MSTTANNNNNNNKNMQLRSGIVSEDSSSVVSSFSLNELASRMRDAMAAKEEQQQLMQLCNATTAAKAAAAAAKANTTDTSTSKSKEDYLKHNRPLEVNSSSSDKDKDKAAANSPADGCSYTYRQRVQAADDALVALRAQLKTHPIQQKMPFSSSSSASSSSKDEQRDDVEVQGRTRQKAEAPRNHHGHHGSTTTVTPSTAPAIATTKATTTTVNFRRNKKEQELRLLAEEKVAKLYAKIGEMDRRLTSAEEQARKERKLKLANEQKVIKLEKIERRLTTQLHQARKAKSDAETKLLAMIEKMSDMDHKLASTEERLTKALLMHQEELHNKNRKAAEVKELRGVLKAAEKKLVRTQKGLQTVLAENDTSTKCIETLRQLVRDKEQQLVASAQQLKDKDDAYHKEIARLKKTDQQIAALQQRLDEKRQQIDMLKEEQRTQEKSLVTNSAQNKYLLSSLEKAKEQCRQECTRRLAAEHELRVMLRANHQQDVALLSSTISSSKAAAAAKPKTDGSSIWSNNSHSGTPSVESWTSVLHAAITKKDQPTAAGVVAESIKQPAYVETISRDDIPYLEKSASEVFSEMEELFSLGSSPRHQELLCSLSSPRHIESVSSSPHHQPEAKNGPNKESTNTQEACSAGQGMEEHPHDSSEKTVETEPSTSCNSKSSSSTQNNTIRKKPDLYVETKSLARAQPTRKGSGTFFGADDSPQKALPVMSDSETKVIDNVEVLLSVSASSAPLANETPAKKAPEVFPVPQETPQPVNKFSDKHQKDPLDNVPVHIKDMYQKVGFYKDRKLNQYLPVLCLALSSMPPGPAQEQVLKAPRNMIGVYMYGCSSITSAYRAIKWFRIIPYENGIEKGLLELPKSIKKKCKKKFPLLVFESDLCRGLAEIQKEANKKESERLHPFELCQQPEESNRGSPLKCESGKSTLRSIDQDASKASPQKAQGKTSKPKSATNGDEGSSERRSESGRETGTIETKEASAVVTMEMPVLESAWEALNVELATAVLKHSMLTKHAGQVVDTFKKCLLPEWHYSTGMTLDLPTGLKLEGGIHKPEIDEVKGIVETKSNNSEKNELDEKKPVSIFQHSFTRTHEKFSAALQKLTAKATVTTSKPSKSRWPYNSDREKDIPEFVLAQQNSDGMDSVSEMGDGGFAPTNDAESDKLSITLLQQILGDEYYSESLEKLRCEQMNSCLEASSCFPSFPSHECGSKDFGS